MSVLNVRAAAGICAMFLSAAFGQTYSNQYALILKDQPVAARFAGKEAMSSAAAAAHRQVIAVAQETLRQAATAKNFTVTGSADVVFNAVFVVATPDRLAELQALPGVLGVMPMRNVKPWLNAATAMQNAPQAWATFGGQSSAGAGVKVGILDYGIDITHPAMQDSSLALPTSGGPWPKCTTGHQEDCAFTNTKVIVARSYVRSIAPGSSSTNPAADSRPDDYRPMDREGHGTAVASVIAGNPAKGSVTISGMAPKAWLGMYKIFGSPNVNDAVPESVIIQAVNDAVTDGMDSSISRAASRRWRVRSTPGRPADRRRACLATRWARRLRTQRNRQWWWSPLATAGTMAIISRPSVRSVRPGPRRACWR